MILGVHPEAASPAPGHHGFIFSLQSIWKQQLGELRNELKNLDNIR
jgi:hypothetical protein